MFIHFDPKTMHVQVICGALEEHKPSSELKYIYAEVETLKIKLTKFQEEINPKLQEIIDKIETENKKFMSETNEDLEETSEEN